MPQDNPPDPDTPAEISPQADGRAVQGLFSRIARVYDLFNHVGSFGMDFYWRKRLVDSVLPFPPKGTARILDLAAGTLDVTVGLARRYPHRSVLAVDFCHPMLAQGIPKLARVKNQRVQTLVGDGRRLPLPDESVDAITIAFGLRNIRPRSEAYAEALRVLTPGGRFCVLEFGSAQDRILFGIYNIYLRYVLPIVGKLLAKDKRAFTYLVQTIIQYPSAEKLVDEMRSAGFVNVRHETMTAGIVCLHTGSKQMQSSRK